MLGSFTTVYGRRWSHLTTSGTSPDWRTRVSVCWSLRALWPYRPSPRCVRCGPRSASSPRLLVLFRGARRERRMRPRRSAVALRRRCCARTGTFRSSGCPTTTMTPTTRGGWRLLRNLQLVARQSSGTPLARREDARATFAVVWPLLFQRRSWSTQRLQWWRLDRSRVRTTRPSPPAVQCLRVRSPHRPLFRDLHVLRRRGRLFATGFHRQ
jgi:hypothetical protein